MKSMSKILFSTALVLIAAAGAAPADFNGYISVDTVQAVAGEHLGVKVRLHDNDMAFSTIFVPIRYHSPFLTLDSVSYNGSIKPDDFTGFDYNFDDLGIVQISYIPPLGTSVPAIHSTGGILAELFFTVSSSADPAFLPIDSVSIDSVIIFGGIEKHYWIRIAMSDSTGNLSHYPDCVPGGIEVRAPTDVTSGADGSALPVEFALSQNYPNPFNPSTNIIFALPEAGHVKLEVFNVLGQAAATLVDRRMPAGVHQIEFDAAAYPSGIYFYRLTQGGFSQTKKMALVK